MDFPRLTIELVPRTCWFSNVRSEVSQDDWDRLRFDVYTQARNRCEVCGGRGPRHPVECHEIWHYDDQHHIQQLLGLIALCPLCHSVKHYGLAAARGVEESAFNHLARVNKWGTEQAVWYISEQFTVWRERSEHNWHLDITWLEQRGISVAPREGRPGSQLELDNHRELGTSDTKEADVSRLTSCPAPIENFAGTKSTRSASVRPELPASDFSMVEDSLSAAPAPYQPPQPPEPPAIAAVNNIEFVPHPAQIKTSEVGSAERVHRFSSQLPEAEPGVLERICGAVAVVEGALISCAEAMWIVVRAPIKGMFLLFVLFPKQAPIVIGLVIFLLMLLLAILIAVRTAASPGPDYLDSDLSGMAVAVLKMRC